MLIADLNLYLVISAIFLFTLLFGKVLDRARLPWIFSALALGILFSVIPQIQGVLSLDEFKMLANWGLLLLLFLIGLEIDLKHIAGNSGYIFRSAVVIIFLEALVGSLLVHQFFHIDWVISFLVSLSFATVGEAVLVPILDTFGITNTPLGSSLLSIGTLDDLVEVVALVGTVSIIDFKSQSQILYSGLSLLILFILTYSFTRIKKRTNNFNFHPVETMFLFAFFTFFLFVGIGEFADASSLGALLAGISIKQFMPAGRLAQIEKQVKAVGYGLFAPIFFVSVGNNLQIDLLFKHWQLVLLIVLVSSGMKILSSILTSYNRLGIKGAVLLGVGLSVKFSLSLVIISLLFKHHLISEELYSVMVGSSVIFVVVMPMIFSQLILIWKDQLPFTHRLKLSVRRS